MDDDAGGGRPPVVPDEDFLRLLAESDDPVSNAKELANELPIQEPGVYTRLTGLEDRNLVESKKLGQARAWWITDAGRDYLDEG